MTVLGVFDFLLTYGLQNQKPTPRKKMAPLLEKKVSTVRIQIH
jgi:hypothetical protein